MTTRPVQISFRNMSVSPALEEEIRSRAAWLESFCPGIVGCRVLLEVPHRHRRRGRPLHVRIEVSIPGEDVIVNHEPTLDATSRPAPHKSDELDGRHKDAHVAIHEAFDVARRRLEDAARRQRGDVKARAAARES
jgi:ribosome-associated translation inhibitor RaiA